MNDKEFSNRIRTAFPGGEPSEEFLSKLKNAEIPKKKRKRMVVVFAVAAAIYLFGSISSYAVSNITFKELFGDSIHVADCKLADSLLGSVSDFRYMVSDDDYAIRILGISGPGDNIIGQAEIYRKDGKPVKEFFLKGSEDDTLYPSLSLERYLNGSLSYDFNDSGNIQIRWKLDSKKGLFKKKVGMYGIDFYYLSDGQEFQEKNNIMIDLYDGELHLNYRRAGVVTENENVSIDEIAALKLTWSFSLKYDPSKVMKYKKKCSSFKEDFTLIQPVSLFSVDSSGNGHDLEVINREIICKPSKVEFSAGGGTVKFTYSDDYDFDGYISEKYSGLEVDSTRQLLINSDENEMYLIKSDGSHIYFRIGSNQSSSSGEKIKAEMSLYYYDPEIKDGPNHLYEDISDVESVYINGVTYRLK